MTKNEARKIIRFAHGGNIDTDACLAPVSIYSQAAMTLAEPPTIAQSIRDAAINWPQFLGDVECSIMAAFAYESDGVDCIFGLRMQGTPWAEEDSNQSRTFMLLVAEALE